MTRNQDVEAYRQTYRKGKSEWSGRSESEHRSGRESEKPWRPNLQPESEGSKFNRKLTDTVELFGGVVVAAWS